MPEFLDLPVGNWADLLAAAGTILAFAVTYRLLRHEIQLSRRTKSEKRREQASKVNAWFWNEADWAVATGRAEPDSSRRGDTWLLTIRNGGAQPVYDLEALAYLGSDPPTFVASALYAVVPPDTTLIQRIDMKKDLIGPIEMSGPNMMFVTAWVFAASVSFADSEGRNWERAPSGFLEEVPVLRPKGLND